jgi:hypothetical protein
MTTARSHGVQIDRPPGATRGGPHGVCLEAPQRRKQPPRPWRGGRVLRKLALALGGVVALVGGTGAGLSAARTCTFPDPLVSGVVFAAVFGAQWLVNILLET